MNNCLFRGMFNQNNDKDVRTKKLEEEHHFKSQLCSLNVSPDMNNLQRKYYHALYNNIKLARSICLLKLSQSDDFTFFDTPCHIEMYQCTQKEPVKINKHFNIIISQLLMAIIADIYKNHEEFAFKVFKHFSGDISLITSFGASTFPALYGFFTTLDLCKRGAKIIKDFILNPTMIDLAESMLSSYFTCAFAFNHCLWSTFHKMLIKTKNYDELKNDKIIKLIIKSTEIATPLLSKYHAKTIDLFYNTSPSLCSSFIARHIYQSSFDSFFSGATHFMPNAVRVQIRLCFSEIMDKGFKTCGQIADILAAGGTGFVHPDAPTKFETHKTPLILSDRDVLVLLEILKEGNSNVPLEDLFDVAPVLFKNGYAPFTFEFYSTDRYDDEVELETTPEISRVYKTVCQKALNNGTDPVTFLRENRESLKNVSCNYRSVYRYALMNSSLQYSVNIERLERLLNIRTKIDQAKSFSSRMEVIYKGVLAAHLQTMLPALGIVNRTLSSNVAMKYTMSNIRSVFGGKTLAEDLRLPVFCAVLDATSVIPDARLSSINLQALSSLAPTQMRLASAMRGALSTAMRGAARNADAAMHAGLGQQFLALSGLVAAADEAAGVLGATFEDAFDCGLLLTEENSLLGGFFLVNAIVGKAQAEAAVLGQPELARWLRLSSRMLEVIEPRTLEQYFRYDFNQKEKRRRRSQ